MMIPTGLAKPDRKKIKIAAEYSLPNEASAADTGQISRLYVSSFGSSNITSTKTGSQGESDETPLGFSLPAHQDSFTSKQTIITDHPEDPLLSLTASDNPRLEFHVQPQNSAEPQTRPASRHRFTSLDRRLAHLIPRDLNSQLQPNSPALNPVLANPSPSQPSPSIAPPVGAPTVGASAPPGNSQSLTGPGLGPPTAPVTTPAPSPVPSSPVILPSPSIPPIPSKVAPIPSPLSSPDPSPISPDTPTPLPAPRREFNLSNSSLVISISHPSHSPQNPSNTVSSASGQSSLADTSKPTSSSSSGITAQLLIAILAPVLLILGLSVAIVIRSLRRRKRGRHVENGHSTNNPPQPTFRSSALTQENKRNSLLKVGRQDSSYSNMESQRTDDDLSPGFTAWGEARKCPPLPPSSAPCDPVASETNSQDLKLSNSGTNVWETANVDLTGAGGIPCKQRCVVSRTFVQSMPDELKIGIGDRVVVHLLFDDGWCLGDNLDIAKHRIADGQSYARAGVLPQDCLTGLNRDSIAGVSTSDMSVMTTWATAAEEPINQVQPQSHEPNGQEILLNHNDVETLLAPSFKPQRHSSLLCDRESDLMRELEFALAHVS